MDELSQSGQSDSRDGTPMIAVRMSAGAAEALAKACRVAYYALLDELQVEGQISHEKDAAMEFLDWGSRWLVNPDARREVLKAVGPDKHPLPPVDELI